MLRWRALVVVASYLAVLQTGSARAAGGQTEPDDMVVDLRRPDATIQVSLGRTLSVARPTQAERWSVDYAGEILVMLTSEEKRQAPGPAGWRFRAAGVGETAVAFTESGSGGGGAPPAPPRFVVTIQVKAR